MILATGLLFFLNTRMSKEDFAVLGLACAVPALHRADRRRLPDPPRRLREPRLQGDAGPQGRKQGAARRTAPQAQEGRPLLHDDLHRQQRRRLPADRLLHLLRHQDAEDADPADPAGHHAGFLRLAHLHAGRRLALGQDRPRQDVPARLRDRLRLDDPDVRPHRHQGHRALRRRAVRPHDRPGPVLRAHVRHVRRDVPGERPLLRHLDRLRVRRHPRRRVRGHHRGGPAAGHPLDRLHRHLHHDPLRHFRRRRPAGRRNQGPPAGRRSTTRWPKHAKH